MSFTLTSALVWPTVLRRERSMKWMPDFGNQSSPQALDGTRQYRSTNGGGLWRAVFTGFQLMNRTQVLAWYALESQARGGATPIDVRACVYRARRTSAGTPIELTSDGGWAERSLGGDVHFQHGDSLEPGMHFSFNGNDGWRLYRIESVVAQGGNVYELTWWPPFRDAVSDDDELEIESPRCVMRLAQSDSMDLDTELRKRGNPSAEFVEAF